MLLLSTVIGVRCKDGVVLAAEKLMISPLLKASSNKMIHKVEHHLGMVSVTALSLFASQRLTPLAGNGWLAA